MEKLKSIYFLRGVAAVAVVLQHSFVHDGTLAPGPFLLDLVYDITNYGYLGVALFFIISGFCIHLRTAKNIRLKGRVELDWKDFWWRRVYRLYPPYIGMLLISMALWMYVWSQGGANIYPGPRRRVAGSWISSRISSCCMVFIPLWIRVPVIPHIGRSQEKNICI
jgi:peptidoglycan/LPS O-acetylase OafA/YrhL